MDNLWFEEELVPTEGTVAATVKSLHRSDSDAEDLKNASKSVLRYSKPRWVELDPKQSNLLGSGEDSRFILTRFGFEFDLSEHGRETGSRFSYARCEAYLWSAKEDEPQPTVYDLIPKDLYEGEPRKVQVKIGPEIKLGEVGGSLGEISTDFTMGYVEPAVVGWPGKDNREPYWELRPHSKSLLGVRYLWVIIEIPKGCSGVSVAVKSAGEVTTPLFKAIPIVPKSWKWESRPRETIGLITV
ncbi:MAG: hypothetical protein WAQ99_02930 [Pyrinomonadaceae bacterium]